jgi:hypothetical protein
MLESDGLDLTTEKCVLLFQLIERGVQLRDKCLSLITPVPEPVYPETDPLTSNCRICLVFPRWIDRGLIETSRNRAAIAYWGQFSDG